MNIKQHIEAGHYPKDDRGFPLVRREAGEVYIISTNGPDPRYEIIGGLDGKIYGWDADGVPWLGMSETSKLLPPRPRKAKVEAWAIVRSPTDYDIRPDCPSGVATGIETLVRLTGEYEEPWDMTTQTPIKKFPWPFADRQPQFVPRNIDPMTAKLRTYPAWHAPKSYAGLYVIIGILAALCIWVAFGWIGVKP